MFHQHNLFVIFDNYIVSKANSMVYSKVTYIHMYIHIYIYTRLELMDSLDI